MKYIRNCPVCNSEICYTNYDSFRLTKKANSNCRKCGIKLRTKNVAKNRKLIADVNGFVFKPRINLIGKTINCWEIIGFSGKRSNQKSNFYYWDTKCNNCGIVVSKETSHIKKTRRCRHCHQMPKGMAGLNRLLDTYKRGTRRANRYYEFALTLQQFEKLTSGNCYYCNASPSKIMSNNAYLSSKISHWGDYTYNGIDRVDNSIGYTEANCVPCCHICNWAKSNKGADEFKRYIIGIYNNAIAGTLPFLMTTN